MTELGPRPDGYELQRERQITIGIPERPYSATMRETITRLREVNEQYGFLLFASFGKGEKTVFLFPTMKKEETGLSMLAVTNDGFKVITSDSSSRSIQEMRLIERLAFNGIGKNPNPNSRLYGRGYTANWLSFKNENGSPISIEPDGYHRSINLRESVRCESIQLRDPDPGLAAEIFQLNMDRVNNLNKSAEVVLDMLQTQPSVSPQ